MNPKTTNIGFYEFSSMPLSGNHNGPGSGIEL